MLGKRRVNPSALFAKLFEVTPKMTARIKRHMSSKTHLIILNEILLNIHNYFVNFIAPAVFPFKYISCQLIRNKGHHLI